LTYYRTKDTIIRKHWRSVIGEVSTGQFSVDEKLVLFMYIALITLPKTSIYSHTKVDLLCIVGKS